MKYINVNIFKIQTFRILSQLFFNYNILNNSLIFSNTTLFSISNISRSLFSSIHLIIHEYPRFQRKLIKNKTVKYTGVYS